MNGRYPYPADDGQREMLEGEPPDDTLDALLAADVVAWRATLPAEERFAARMEVMLRSVEFPTRAPQSAIPTAVAAEQDEPDEIQLVREPLDEPHGGRRPPRLPSWLIRARGHSRGRVLPALAMAAVVAVLIVVIQVAQFHQSYVSTAPTQTITARPPITLPGGAWQQISLPVASAKSGDYAISPSDPATIYACFAGATPATSGQVISAEVSLWVTHDTGQHWSTIGLPLSNGTSCQLSMARGDPNRIGVLVTSTGVCGGECIYLSDDGGTHWRAVPYQPIPSNGMLAPQCQLTVTSNAVYMWSSWQTGQPLNGGRQLSAWQRTTDDGQTWQRVDTPFGGNTLFMPWEIGSGENFVASVLQIGGNYINEGTLWITHNGGTSWQLLGSLPPGGDLFVLPSPAPGLNAATVSHPFYALRGEQVPSHLLHLAAYESGDGHTWAQVPPLPVSGATSLRPGMLDVLGIDADGRLFAFGVDPASGVPPDTAQQQVDRSRQWLWVWDPSAARWEQFPTPLDAPWPPFCGALCWQGTVTAGPSGASYLWVDVLGGDNYVTPALYRVLVR